MKKDKSLEDIYFKLKEIIKNKIRNKEVIIPWNLREELHKWLIKDKKQAFLSMKGHKGDEFLYYKKYYIFNSILENEKDFENNLLNSFFTKYNIHTILKNYGVKDEN